MLNASRISVMAALAILRSSGWGSSVINPSTSETNPSEIRKSFETPS